MWQVFFEEKITVKNKNKTKTYIKNKYEKGLEKNLSVCLFHLNKPDISKNL